MPIQSNLISERINTIPVAISYRDSDGAVKEEVLSVKVRNLSFQRWQDMSGDGEIDREVLVKQLADVLVDMDVVDDSGQPVLPTIDYLRTVDLQILVDVNKAVNDYFFPKRMSDNSSDASSSRAVN